MWHTPLPSPPPQGGRGLCRACGEHPTYSACPPRLSAQIACNGIEILIAAAGEIDHHQVILRLLRREVEHAGERVRRLQRRDDAFELAAKLERSHRLVVGGREEFHPAHVVEPSMLWPDAGIIEPGGDRMRFLDLAVVVHQQIGAIAVQHPGPAAGNRGRVLATVETEAGRFHAVDFDPALVEERMEQAHGIGAAANAGDQRIRQPVFGPLHLLARLTADDRLEIAYHGRVRMRPRHRADAIERVVHIGDPIAQRLVHRVLQRLGTRFDGANLGAEDLHPQHVRLLPLDVHGSHVDDAGQAELRAQSCGGDAVHAGAGLGDDARLAHAPREHDLAEHIVDLVRAGVIELLALEIDFRTAAVLSEPLGKIERRRPADVGCEMAVHLGLERGIGPSLGVSPLQIEYERHQRLGDETAAIEPEMPALIGTAAIGIQLRIVGDGAHEALARDCGAAPFAARTKRLTSSSSFSPGARSTPEDTSTKDAPVSLMASPTVSGVRPPDSAKGGLIPLRASQLKGTPLPPGSSASGEALASNRIKSALAAYLPASATSQASATAMAFMTGRPARVLIAVTRSGVSLPCS